MQRSTRFCTVQPGGWDTVLRDDNDGIIMIHIIRRVVVVVVVVVLVVLVAATDHRRQCSCANQARDANSRGSQQAPFLKRKGCPTD